MKKNLAFLLSVLMALLLFLTPQSVMAESLSADEPCIHEWSEWETTVSPTIKSTGSAERYCFLCGETQTTVLDKARAFVKFKKKTYTLKAGKTLKLKSKIRYATGDKVKSWKSLNKSVCTVTKSGKVKALKAGTAKIRVTMRSGKKAVVKIKVKAAARKAAAPRKTAASRSGNSSRSNSKSSSGGTYYWVPSGYAYHVSPNCPTLSRSRTIYSGSTPPSGRSLCKVCG